MTNPTSVEKTVPNITADQIAKLAGIFPECVREGQVNFELLKATLGERLAPRDGYRFTWAGKEEVFQAIQEPSAATLIPTPDESVNWESTQNLFIEGENLEVLKLLYKAYRGRIKMIYIDPPYNTGNDFIYQDDYSEPTKAYLEKTRQIDEEGNYLRSNPETSGRYHSDWLNMMYSRLFLARHFLQDDGVIFVSIDDNEFHHLRMVMNEVFGEANFIGAFIWKSRHNVDSRNKTGMSNDHEYVVIYGQRIQGREIDTTKYSNPDDDPRGPWMSDNMVGLASKEKRPNLHYDLIDPETDINYGCPPKGWRYSPKTMKQKIAEGRVLWPSSPTGRPREKKFLAEIKNQFTGISSLLLDAPNTLAGTQEIRSLFGVDVFDFPKPFDLLKMLLEQGASEDAIVMDFFAGSCPMAQAVLEFNRDSGYDVKYILVQLPEETQIGSPARNEGYSTIAEIGKERIRRAIQNMHPQEGALPLEYDEDLGFKVFKLAPSSFQQWPRVTDPDDFAHQLDLFTGGVREDVPISHVQYELILKEGLDLNAEITAVDAIDSNHVTHVSDGRSEFYLCLDQTVSEETVRALPAKIPALNPESAVPFICLDTALTDTQKVNLSLQCRLKTF